MVIINGQHNSSVTHQRLINSGLSPVWARSGGDGESTFTVVCYSDGSRWLFDNGSAEQLKLLGQISDGLQKSEILQSSNGCIICLYQTATEMFADADKWLDSLPDAEKEEALRILED